MHGIGRWFWGSGRAARSAYWTGLVVCFAASWLAHALAVTLLAHIWLPTVVAPPLLGLEVVISWLSICLICRRLHDFGRSGWWQVVPLAVAFAGFALAEPAWARAMDLSDAVTTVAPAIGGAALAGFMIAVGLVRGSAGPNRFGKPARPA